MDGLMCITIVECHFDVLDILRMFRPFMILLFLMDQGIWSLHLMAGIKICSIFLKRGGGGRCFQKKWCDSLAFNKKLLFFTLWRDPRPYLIVILTWYLYPFLRKSVLTVDQTNKCTTKWPSKSSILVFQIRNCKNDRIWLIRNCSLTETILSTRMKSL